MPNDTSFSSKYRVSHQDSKAHLGYQNLALPLFVGTLRNVTVTLWVSKHRINWVCLHSRDPSYHDKLSLASKGTLINQGGPMSSQEASLFEKHPDFKALLQMRQWDDQAKNKDIPVHSNDCHKELCRDILLSKTC